MLLIFLIPVTDYLCTYCNNNVYIFVAIPASKSLKSTQFEQLH